MEPLIAAAGIELSGTVILPVKVGLVNIVALLSLVTFSKPKSIFTLFAVLPSTPSAVKRAYVAAAAALLALSILTAFVLAVPKVRALCFAFQVAAELIYWSAIASPVHVAFVIEPSTFKSPAT